MRIKAKVEGRDAVMRRLRLLVPEAEKELAKAQLEGAQELAERIRPRAPVGEPGGGAYAASIKGERLAGRVVAKPRKGAKGQTKDPNATGIFASPLWHLLEFGTAERFHKSGKSVGAGPAIPHIFPTYRAFRKRLRRMMAGAVNKAVRRVRNT
ncbi:HK97 gp10 family phage protein [Allomesorhizobium alhagi]|uniref:HK97 gp10 family phage protein n=1 Tax=Allomesorhizobium alhagi TaxID=475067 RepID=UPI000A2F406A|nr:HK97 gp10 family phage protein [Mesorhizobium alhagi]